MIHNNQLNYFNSWYYPKAKSSLYENQINIRNNKDIMLLIIKNNPIKFRMWYYLLYHSTIRFVLVKLLYFIVNYGISMY